MEGEIDGSAEGKGLGSAEGSGLGSLDGSGEDKHMWGGKWRVHVYGRERSGVGGGGGWEFRIGRL